MVDIARFKQLPVAHQEGGQLTGKEIVAIIMDALMGELVDSSAAAPGPAMVFVVFVVDMNVGFGSLGG